MRRPALALLLACLLCACGQKGNLYLPDRPQDAVPATSAAEPAAATGAAAGTTTPPDERDENAARTNRPN